MRTLFAERGKEFRTWRAHWSASFLDQEERSAGKPGEEPDVPGWDGALSDPHPNPGTGASFCGIGTCGVSAGRSARSIHGGWQFIRDAAKVSFGSLTALQRLLSWRRGSRLRALLVKTTLISHFATKKLISFPPFTSASAPLVWVCPVSVKITAASESDGCRSLFFGGAYNYTSAHEAP